MLRSRIAIALDWLALAVVIGILLIELTGGFYTHLGGIRLSARRLERPILVLAGILLVRFALDRRTTAFALSMSDRQRIRARLFPQDGDPDPSLPNPLNWRETALAALGICAFGAVVLHPQLRQMDSVPDLGDPLFSMWRIGWVYRQLLGDPRPLFSGNIFHLEPLPLTYSDSMLLPALTAAPLLALGVHPVHAYNVLFLSGFALSGLAVYVLVQRLTGSPRGAFIAGLIYGFYPYRFDHYSHVELQMTHWMPLALIALHRFAGTAKLLYAVAAALCVVAQWYSSMYYGVFFALYGAAGFAVLAVCVQQRWSRLILPGTIAALLAIALAVPLARPYFRAREFMGDRDPGAVERLSAERLDYLRAPRRSAVYGMRTVPGRQPERALFPGMLPLALTTTALIPPIGISRAAYALGALVAFDGSLGFHGLLFPYLHQWVSPFRSIRVPARFSILVGLSLAVLAGFGAERLLRRFSGTRGTLAFCAMIAVIAAEVWPNLTLQPVWRDPPPIYGSLNGAHGVVLAEFPFNPDPVGFAENTPYMYFSLWHWAQMVNGYSGYLPKGYIQLATRMKDFPDPGSIELLRQRGVTHVTVNCALPGRDCGALLNSLAASSAFRLVVDVRWKGRPVRLYQLVR